MTQALAQFEDRLSVFEGESEISRINAAAGKEPVEVSEETFALIRRSLASPPSRRARFRSPSRR